MRLLLKFKPASVSVSVSLLLIIAVGCLAIAGCSKPPAGERSADEVVTDMEIQVDE